MVGMRYGWFIEIVDGIVLMMNKCLLVLVERRTFFYKLCRICSQGLVMIHVECSREGVDSNGGEMRGDVL